MQVTGRPHAPAALPLSKSPRSKLESGWAPESVWFREEKNTSPLPTFEPRIVQAVALPLHGLSCPVRILGYFTFRSAEQQVGLRGQCQGHVTAEGRTVQLICAYAVRHIARLWAEAHRLVVRREVVTRTSGRAWPRVCPLSRQATLSVTHALISRVHDDLYNNYCRKVFRGTVCRTDLPWGQRMKRWRWPPSCDGVGDAACVPVTPVCWRRRWGSQTSCGVYCDWC